MKRKLEYEMKVTGTRSSQANLDSVKDSVSSINDTFIKTVGAVAGLAVVVKGLTSVFNDFVVQRNSVIRVDKAIGELKGNTDLTSESVKSLASELQSYSDFGDELSLKDMFAPLISSGVRAKGVLRDVGQTIADASAVTGNSLSSITDMFTRAINGNSQSLKTLAETYKVSAKDIENKLNGITDSTERATILTEALGETYKGMSKELSNPLKQLENTLGDLRESIGEAFAPMITSLADSAKAFLESETNVVRLTGAIKGLSVVGVISGFSALNNKLLGFGLLSKGAIGNAKTLASSMLDFNSISKDISLENKSLAGLDRQYQSAISNIEQMSILSKNAGAEQSILIQKALENERKYQRVWLKGMREHEENIAIMNESYQGLFKSIVSSGFKLLGWISIATVAVSTVYQLGKSFGWWGKKIEDSNKAIDENKKKELERRNVYKQSLQSTKDLLEISNRTIAENKELSEYIAKLKDNYDLLIPIEGERAKVLALINDELESQKSFNIDTGSAKSKIQDEIKGIMESIDELEKSMEGWSGFDRYEKTALSRVKNWFTGSSGSTVKTWQGEQFDIANNKVKELLKELDELRRQLTLLEGSSVSVSSPDISPLSKYYELVKFKDDSYMNWKRKMNEKASQEYKDTLIDEGYTVEQAEAHRLRYRGVMNDQLLEQHRLFLESLQAISDSYAPSMEYQDDVVWDTSEYEAILKKREDDLSSYYDMVGNLDKSYYDFKITQINREVEAMQISDDRKATMIEKRMNNLIKEKESYQNYESIVNSSINSVSDTILSYARITTKSSGIIQNVFVNLANSIIAEIGRIMAKMMAMKVLEQSIGLFGFGSTGGVSSIFTGNIGGWTGGAVQFGASNNTNIPSSIVNPSNDGLRSNDVSIIDKLNEVVDAINNNSIKGQIRTIDRVELSQEVERGSRQRSVL